MRNPDHVGDSGSKSEAGVTDYWRKYVALDGAAVGIDRFGECGPTNQVFEFLGMTVSNVIAAVESVILN